MKYQKGVASVAFNGFDLLPINYQPVSVNMVFYPKLIVSPYFNKVMVNVG
jgi:hypothetical protein